MEGKKKMLFIFNPFSGKAQIKSKLFEIIDVFVKGGYEVIVHPTQAVGDGFEKTKELAPQVDLRGHDFKKTKNGKSLEASPVHRNRRSGEPVCEEPDVRRRLFL